MSKTSVVHARVNTELKENVENILMQIGLTSSEAVNLFYKQVELYNGLPFQLRIPRMRVSEARSILLSKLGEAEQEEGWLSKSDLEAMLEA